MGRIVTTILNRFDGGMSNDIRNSYESSGKDFLVARNKARIIQNFDILTASSKMTPHFDDQADSTGNTEKLCMYLTYGATAKQYALGVVSATSRAKIFERASLPQGAWGASTGGQGSDGAARSEKVFVAYNDGTDNLIFGLSGGAQMWQYNITTQAFTNALISFTYTNTAQGLVHSKDDVCYIPVDNVILSKNGSAVFTPYATPALTLPRNSIITAIWESGNYLAIATKPKGLGGKSIIYYWDRDSSLATTSEKVDGGSNAIRWGENLGGYEIVCSVAGYTAEAITKIPKVIFSYKLGEGLKTIAEFNTTNTTVLFGNNIQKTNGRIYFLMQAEINSVVYMGLWSIGQNASGQFSYCMEHQLNNGATTFTASDLPLGFELLGDYLSVAYSVAGVYVARMTNATVFSNFSDFQSLIFNEGDSDVTKELIGATVTFEPLSTSGITGTPTVVLKYRKEGETSFTQIFSYATLATITHGAINIESSGVGLPEYREIEFQIQSKGNAVITGLKWRSEIVEGKGQLY